MSASSFPHCLHGSCGLRRGIFEGYCVRSSNRTHLGHFESTGTLRCCLSFVRAWWNRDDIYVDHKFGPPFLFVRQVIGQPRLRLPPRHRSNTAQQDSKHPPAEYESFWGYRPFLSRSNDTHTSPPCRRVCRRAHQDRKLRSAEDLILAAKMSSSKGTAVDTGNQEGGAQQQPPPVGHNSFTEKTERPRNSITTATTDTPAGNSIEPRLLAIQHGHNTKNNDLMAEDGGACPHESLVDVSRRPARAPRKYAEEELDRYCESHSSTTTKVGPLRFAPTSLFSIGGGDDGGYGKSARKTPRRVPVRPNSSGKGVTRGRIRGESGIRSGSASPRAVRGQLVVSQGLSAR